MRADCLIAGFAIGAKCGRCFVRSFLLSFQHDLPSSSDDFSSWLSSSDEIAALLRVWAPPSNSLDALVLLGAAFLDTSVRQWAVGHLAKCDDAELLAALPQLLQAFKLESYLDK